MPLLEDDARSGSDAGQCRPTPRAPGQGASRNRPMAPPGWPAMPIRQCPEAACRTPTRRPSCTIIGNNLPDGHGRGCCLTPGPVSYDRGVSTRPRLLAWTGEIAVLSAGRAEDSPRRCDGGRYGPIAAAFRSGQCRALISMGRRRTRRQSRRWIREGQVTERGCRGVRDAVTHQSIQRAESDG